MVAQTQLVGIARLAASGELLEHKRRVAYHSLPTRKWLNRCHSTRVPFDWTINPYRGCEFGCKYCYARYTHEFMELREAASFETEIYAKDWDPHAFLEELRAVRPGHIIAIGTATDPYQPAERRFFRTRQALDLLCQLRGVSICITTKSNLVARDCPQLEKLAQHNQVFVTLTVTTLDGELARLLEPFAPRPDLRMEAVAKLAAAGIPTGVISSPVLPFLTDSEQNLASVAQAAKQAGAHHFGAGVLFLKPCAQRVFFPFLAERFPEYVGRYERLYGDKAFLQGAYPKQIRERVARIRKQAGFPCWDRKPILPSPPPAAQMSLF